MKRVSVVSTIYSKLDSNGKKNLFGGLVVSFVLGLSILSPIFTSKYDVQFMPEKHEELVALGTQAIETSVDTINPYEQTTSPLSITATGDTCLDNVTLYYRYSCDNSSWWDSNWTYRKKITIDHNQVAGTLTNFPILVNITDTNLTTKAQADGDDIVFTNATGNKLNHEIELYNNITGNLIAWVNVTELKHDVDTTIYMYYGNSGASNQENIAGTWDSNYVAVYHGGGSGTTVFNSVGVNGTASNGRVLSDDIGKIGYYFNFENNDFINTNSQFSMSGAITCSVMFNRLEHNNTGVNKFLVNNYDKNAIKGIYLVADDVEALFDFIASAGNQRGWSHSGTIMSNTWYFFYGKSEYNLSGATAFLNYIECSNSINMGTVNNIPYSSRNFVIGAQAYYNGYGTERFFTGLVDEVRISNIARSANWINTEYNNQVNASTFLTTSSEESWMNFETDTNYADGGWNWSFNFPNSIGYYEFYSIGKKSGSTDENAPSSKDAMCHYTPPVNHDPSVTAAYPVDDATDVSVNIAIHNITVSDPDGNDMNYTYRYFIEGCNLGGDNTGAVGNGTYTLILNDGACCPLEYDTVYTWWVNVSDGNGGYDNQTFSFTTESAPVGRVWSDIMNGYLSGGNISSYNSFFDGYLTGGNVSVGWNELFDNWYTGGNTSGWSELFDNWFSGGNVTPMQDFFDNWYTGGNTTPAPKTWYELFDNWYTGGNTTPAEITITNVYPSNNSNVAGIQPQIYFTLSSQFGLVNYTVYVGNSTVNTTTVLFSDTGVVNGTYYHPYLSATTIGEYYYFRVFAEYGGVNVSEVVVFRVVGSGGGSGSNARVFGIVGLLGALGIIGFLWGFKRRNKRRRYYEDEYY